MLKKLLDMYAKLSSREKVILFVVFFAVSALFFDRFVLGPVSEKMQRLQADIQGEEDAVRKSMHVLLRKSQITAEDKEFMSFSVDSKNPEEEMTSLLQEIETLAKQSYVSLLYVKPGNTEDKEQTRKYLASLECEAEMSRVIVFFHLIESSPKLLQIEKYDIQPGKSKDKGPTSARCVMTVSKTVLRG